MSRICRNIECSGKHRFHGLERDSKMRLFTIYSHTSTLRGYDPGSVGIICFTAAKEFRGGGSWARKDEGEPADTPDEFKNGPRTGGT